MGNSDECACEGLKRSYSDLLAQQIMLTRQREAELGVLRRDNARLEEQVTQMATSLRLLLGFWEADRQRLSAGMPGEYHNGGIVVDPYADRAG
jgi:hypothetical protein